MNKTELIDRIALLEMLPQICDELNGCAAPYNFDEHCVGCEVYMLHKMLTDLPTIDAEWELFKRITDTYYDKEMFFLQDDGSVYDRMEAAYHASTDAAIDAFIRRISEG